jgi:hypothetical protein
MKVHEIYTIAKSFGILPESALSMRIRYLKDRIQDYKDDAETDYRLLAWWILVDLNEMLELKKYLYHEIEKRENNITADMISRAKSTPVETIIDFKRGKTRCISPDHADRNPSAYYASRNNTLQCPVCNKGWDAIACYQYMFNCDFKTAVKSLQ